MLGDVWYNSRKWQRMVAIAGGRMAFEDVNYTYIVAGDEMARVRGERHPERKIIPFREDLSKGNYKGFAIDSVFISERACFWGVSDGEYTEKLRPIIHIDLADELVLCFGEDECCRANMEFMIGYLRGRGSAKALRVNIVDEYTLDLLNEYFVD